MYQFSLVAINLSLILHKAFVRAIGLYESSKDGSICFLLGRTMEWFQLFGKMPFSHMLLNSVCKIMMLDFGISISSSPGDEFVLHWRIADFMDMSLMGRLESRIWSRFDFHAPVYFLKSFRNYGCCYFLQYCGERLTAFSMLVINDLFPTLIVGYFDLVPDMFLSMPHTEFISCCYWLLQKDFQLNFWLDLKDALRAMALVFLYLSNVLDFEFWSFSFSLCVLLGRRVYIHRPIGTIFFALAFFFGMHVSATLRMVQQLFQWMNDRDQFMFSLHVILNFVCFFEFEFRMDLNREFIEIDFDWNMIAIPRVVHLFHVHFEQYYCWQKSDLSDSKSHLY